jgi:hypothetical protein
MPHLPEYEWTDPEGHRRTVKCRLSDLDALTRELTAKGWKRLFSAVGAVIIPGYFEAKQESEDILQAEERKMAADRREAARDVADAVREEYGSP